MYYRIRTRINIDSDWITVNISTNLRDLIEELNCLVQNCKENDVEYKDRFMIEDEDFNLVYMC